MYRILEDENGKFWIAKISRKRIILQKGSWHNIDKVPNNINDVGYLQDYRQGREIIYDTSDHKFLT